MSAIFGGAGSVLALQYGLAPSVGGMRETGFECFRGIMEEEGNGGGIMHETMEKEEASFARHNGGGGIMPETREECLRGLMEDC